MPPRSACAPKVHQTPPSGSVTEVFEKFMTRLLNHPHVKPLLSDKHFSVDGTLIEAWASQRSFRPKDGSDGDGSDFHGQTRKNDTHRSTTDPDSRLYRKALLGAASPGHILPNLDQCPVRQCDLDLAVRRLFCDPYRRRLDTSHAIAVYRLEGGFYVSPPLKAALRHELGAVDLNGACKSAAKIRGIQSDGDHHRC
jgi:hypothetical protein